MSDPVDETRTAGAHSGSVTGTSTGEAGPIPAIGHFVWLGARLPWYALMAIRSARARGGFDRVVLHHEPRMGPKASLDELRGLDDVELRVLDTRVLFEKLESEGVPALSQTYERLTAPAARADLLRLAILALEGGIYVDCDTLTLRDFGDLRRSASAFVGTEHILHPSPEAGAAVQLGRARSVGLQLLRTALSRVGFGWRGSLRLQHLYPSVANNAIIGATPGHPFLFDLFARIRSMSPERQCARFALGPHLLQVALADGKDHDVEVLRPAVLFPLGPVVSQHWFKARRSLPPLSALVQPDTIAIHWYASSPKLKKLLPTCDDAYVRSHRDRQLYSALACAILDEAVDDELAR